MKALIDENIDEGFLDLMPEHELHHVRAMGWQGTADGRLLQLATENAFEVFVTADKNMPYQQNMKGRPFALIVLDTHPVNFANLAACVAPLRTQLATACAGETYTVNGPRLRRLA